MKQVENKGGVLSTQQVVGQNTSLMIAERSGGYHSKPHVHNCEQMNYLAKGKVSIFVEKEVYHLEEGDFLRIPANAVHWAWNRSPESCVLIESHTPALNILPESDYVILLSEEESYKDVQWAKNIFASEDYLKIEKEIL